MEDIRKREQQLEQALEKAKEEIFIHYQMGKREQMRLLNVLEEIRAALCKTQNPSDQSEKNHG